MNLKKISLTNFRNFKDTNSFSFTKLTQVSGDNGTGKTTLSLLSILFAIYGWSEESLDKLVNKGNKSTKVEVEIDNLRIIREYPTTLRIFKNNEELVFPNTIEKQNYLNTIFKNIDYFRKFRMIDTSKGINILESGKVAIKKTLFSFNESYFNNVRNNLLNKKRERELYNKDKAVLYTLFPSQKRLDFINMKLIDLAEQLNNIEKEIISKEKDYYELNNKKGKQETIIDYHKSQKNRISQYSECPTCKRSIEESHKIELLKESNKRIAEANGIITELLSESNEYKDLLEYFKKLKRNLNLKKDKLYSWQFKLDSRIKQKDYKYSNKDILIVKQAIEELDNFLSYYLAEWAKILEPIINSLLEKIGYKVEFILNTKGDFDIKILKEDKEYTYRELSSGQKLLLSIAFQLAILLERGETGLIIADEGFSSLDEKNLNLIIDFFRSIPFQLIYIVHRFDVPYGVKNINLI